jgi:hypothetical protein
MRMTSVEPSCLGPGSCRHPLALLPQLANQAREILGPDAHLERVLLHVDPLDEELNDARLLGREQLVPDLAKSASRIVTSRSVISSPARFAAAHDPNSGAGQVRLAPFPARHIARGP